jgi:hypothetical protein
MPALTGGAHGWPWGPAAVAVAVVPVAAVPVGSVCTITTHHRCLATQSIRRRLGRSARRTNINLTAQRASQCSTETGGLYDAELKAHSEAEARGESRTGARGCRFIVASGWRLRRNGAGGGPAQPKDRTGSRNHPRRGRAFRRQPVDLLCLRQGEREASAWRPGRLAWMRRLSVRRRLPLWPLRLRLARLRWLWLRRLWLLRFMGTLPHLLKGTLRSNPEHNKSPSQYCATGRGPTVLAVPTERGAISIRPTAWRESIADGKRAPSLKEKR